MAESDDGALESGPTAPASAGTDAGAEVVRLERRLRRERAAREQAEAIAERRMRELWQANVELDARVAERTADLSAALAELAERSAGHDAFLAWLSHEVRTPLNGLLGMLELLESYVVDDRAATYLGQAGASAQQLERLLRRLLVWVELDADRLQPERRPVRPSEIMAALAERWRGQLMANSQLLSVTQVGLDQAILADRDRISIVVEELLANVARHAGPGLVSVEVTAAESQLQVELVDPGAHSAPTVEADQGMGLTLANRLVAALGGDLEVEFGPDRGRVWLTVPAELASETNVESRTVADHPM